ncbi:MAG: hypothetical protein FD188_3161 [Ignavibacteria bacterium]|nr:MAG: hypothetical protein FD188_3161 [Ignavibacteria bacterium]
MVIIRQAHDRVCRTMTLQTKLPRFLPPVSPSAHQAGDRLSLPAASRCDNRLIIQMFLVKKSMESVFVDLKKIMKKYQHMLEIIDDTENVYSLNSAYSEKYKRKIWFVGIRIMTSPQPARRFALAGGAARFLKTNFIYSPQEAGI